MITRKCSYCLELHEAMYQIFRNKTKHLFVLCPNRGKKGKGVKIWIPFEKDLDIKTFEGIDSQRRRIFLIQNLKDQQPLF